MYIVFKCEAFCNIDLLTYSILSHPPSKFELILFISLTPLLPLTLDAVISATVYHS